MSDEAWYLLEPHLLRQRGQWERDYKRYMCMQDYFLDNPFGYLYYIGD